MFKIMAINAGSSSLKFQLFEMPGEEVITKGIVERIGLKESVFTISVKGEKVSETVEIPNHETAVSILLEKLLEWKIISSYAEINGIGHRVVHGGEVFADSVLINGEVIRQIDRLSELAPLHNPANLTGIKAFQSILGETPAVAVFDTAFHQTMDTSTYLYSLPYEFYQKYKIRKYGFHGTSHKYVSLRAAEMIGRPLRQLRLISCHLGSGVSITAIHEGKSIDTSMGFTPLAGVTMGTRSGNIDPALIPYIMEKTGKTADEVLDILNKESGLLALSGFSSDLRDIMEDAGQGNTRAKLAIQVFADRIHHYIGAYAAKMGGVDGIIFTAGVGENSDLIRAHILENLEFLGIYLDKGLNHRQNEEAFISKPGSPVKVMVIPTNEEVMIARDTMRVAIQKVSRDPAEQGVMEAGKQGIL
ncbi:acetate/propionate family kinase [Bacillus massiliglaciei]|uniref:acetate/propionate family kinase n=1 Tax=Bacillus massiliglaciei TaxID=1816693 RepID=UPI000AB87BE5|nr:acetate kinase [Bacillus massiliglaciei]